MAREPKSPVPSRTAQGAQAEIAVRAAEGAYQQAEYATALQKARLAVRQGAGASAHLIIGQTLEAMGRLDEAHIEYGRVLELDPGNALAHQGQKSVRKKR